ncbi:hypothetical protein M9Y10_017586 [Tritrichomonas musculus]|uniref:EGF-like domain-containing protein n=1 Tax=Tritrichomonas musculus TaxID=1915356 RepID=A0ABR2HUB6_9EUKA
MFILIILLNIKRIKECSDINNCKECSDSTTCTECEDGYLLYINRCVTCQFLKQSSCALCQVEDNVVHCKECIDGYLLTGETDDFPCTQCETNFPGCQSCERNDLDVVCKQCKEGYLAVKDGEVITSCTECSVTNCETCDPNEPTKCSKCNTNFGLTSNGECEECTDGKESDGTKPCAVSCSVTNCETCDPNEPTKCSKCNTNFGLTSNGECEECTDGKESDGTKPCAVSCSVTNCETCDPNEPTKCSKCNTNFGLTSNGECEECTDGKESDGTKPCAVSCSVTNCETCDPNEPTKCSKCNTNFGLTSNGECEECTDGKESDGTKPCAVSCSVTNCETCDPNEPTKCSKCNTNFGLTSNGECEECTDGKESDGTKPCAVSCSVTNCETCDPNEPTKCSKCNTNFGLTSNGECEECTDGKESDGTKPCAVPPSSDECEAVDEKDAGERDCVECSEDKKTCTKCFNGEYFVPNAKGQCVLKCFVGQNHCSECNADFTECSKCDSDELNPYLHGCLCKDEKSEYVDGKCVKQIESWEPAEVKLESFGTQSVQGGVQTIDTSAIETVDASKYYTQEISREANEIKIINKNNANLLLEIHDKEISVQLDSEDTKVTLECPDQAKIKLNNAPNVIINAKGSLSINPIDANLNEIKVGKVVLYESVESITSDKNLVITELQVFKSKGFKATKENIKIETVKIEQGGTFEPSSNLQLAKIEIGINSELEVNDAWEDSEITIYYNRPQPDEIENMVFPLSLSVLPNSFPKTFTIKKKELGQLLEDKDYNILAVPEMEKIDVNEKCIQLANLYNSKDAVFSRADCKPYDLRGKKYYLLYATNTSGSKKKGLSAGAIAGIVIACVVVVAGVAVLVWYFAFYKKKVGVSADEAEP